MKVRTGSADENGMLMVLDEELVAILVELTDEIHGETCGRWALEQTFGLFSASAPETFVGVDQAWDWIIRATDGTRWPVVGNEKADAPGVARI